MNDSKFETSKTKNCISPSPILLDGQVDLHVEDDESQEGQDHCEDKFQILLVDLRQKNIDLES